MVVFYRQGRAAMLSASYSMKGSEALLQIKRSEDMSWQSSHDDGYVFIHQFHGPRFHAANLRACALYPYATQNVPGEWVSKANIWLRLRHTALGGKYGMHVKVNASAIFAL